MSCPGAFLARPHARPIRNRWLEEADLRWLCRVVLLARPRRVVMLIPVLMNGLLKRHVSQRDDVVNLLLRGHVVTVCNSVGTALPRGARHRPFRGLFRRRQL